MIELCDADYRTGSSIAKIAHLHAPNNIYLSARGRCDQNFDLVVSTCRPRVSISDTPRVLSETIGVVVRLRSVKLQSERKQVADRIS